MWLREDGIDAARVDPGCRLSPTRRWPTWCERVGRGPGGARSTPGRRRRRRLRPSPPRPARRRRRASAPRARPTAGSPSARPSSTARRPAAVADRHRRGDARAGARPFPVAVPLLDQSHLHDLVHAGQPGRRPRPLVESLLLRVLELLPARAGARARVGRRPAHRVAARPLPADPHRPADRARPGAAARAAGRAVRPHPPGAHPGAGRRPPVAARAGRGEAGGAPSRGWSRCCSATGNALREEDQRQLQRVARGGLACGISARAASTSRSRSTRRWRPSGVRRRRHGPATLHDDRQARDGHARPAAAPRRTCTAPAAAIADEHERAGARRVAHVRRPAARTGSGDARTRRRASCAPVGFAEGEPVDVRLGDASPHALIGGPSGSGKTNLLLRMIGSLAARYSPGRAGALPARLQGGRVVRPVRARAAGTRPGCRTRGWSASTSTPTASSALALLQYLVRRDAPARRGGQAARGHQARGAARRRTRGGRWPRIVAVIDEFQYLFGERDAVTSRPSPAAGGRRPARPLAGHPPGAGQPGRLRHRGVLGPSGDLRAVRAADRAAQGAPGAGRDATTPTLDLPRWHAVVNHESGMQHGNEIVRIPDATTKGPVDEVPAQAARAGSRRRERGAAAVRRQPRARRSTSCSRGPARTGDEPPRALRRPVHRRGTAARPRCRCPRRRAATSGCSARPARTPCAVLGAAAAVAGRAARHAARSGSCSPRWSPRRVARRRRLEHGGSSGHDVDDRPARRVRGAASSSSPPRWSTRLVERRPPAGLPGALRAATPPTPCWTAPGRRRCGTVLRLRPGDRRAHDRVVAQPAAAAVAALAGRVARRPRLRSSALDVQGAELGTLVPPGLLPVVVAAARAGRCSSTGPGTRGPRCHRPGASPSRPGAHASEPA